MRAVVQRVSGASVSVEGATVASIGQGLLVFLGVGQGDTEREAQWVAHKTANLRVFADGEGKMNLSVREVRGSILVVSQFTLYGDVHKGFRPSFVSAAPPEAAQNLVAAYQCQLVAEGIPVASGIFRAHMKVELVNDGPVTILIDRAAGEGM